MSILVYTPKNTNRVKYATQFLFKRLLNLEVTLTTAKSSFLEASGVRINYSNENFDSTAFYIIAHSLLFESEIHPSVLEVQGDREYPCFFNKPDEEADFPFDLLALSFYLLTRYEEYLPFEADQHGRFPAQQSLAFREGFLRMPLIDLWSLRLKAALQKKYPQLVFKTHAYCYLPSYDIDHAWAYLHKGLGRSIGAAAKDLLKFRGKSLLARWQTHFGRIPDPFQSFDFLDKLHRSGNAPPSYFFLLGDYAKYDKNIDPQNPALRKLIRRIATNYTVGIHPSYQSNEAPQRLQLEQKRLEKIINQKVTKSRQHFLRLRFPETYRNLIKAGIQEDYSMGYAAEIGFRAGTAHDFLWFDLKANECTDLRVFPFQVMDVTLRNYLGLSPAAALSATQQLIDQCRLVGGRFCSLWHNSSFAPLDGWTEEWKEVYQQLYRSAQHY